MKDELFKIDLEVFCDRYKVDQKCMDEMAIFLMNHGYSYGIPEFYEQFISRQLSADALMNKLTHKDKWKENFKDGDTQREMVRQLYTYHDIVNEGTKINWYYFPYFQDGNNFSNGVILNPPFLLDWKNLRHKHLFSLLFAGMLSQTTLPSEYLYYHLNNSFKKNKAAYNQFLVLMAGDHKDYIQNRLDFVKTWIEHELTSCTIVDSKNTTSLRFKLTPEITELKSIFKNDNDFKACVNTLKEVHPPIINEKNKYILGSKSLGAIVAWIDALKRKDKIKISEINDDQLAELLKSFFNLSTLSGRTIRATKTRAYTNYYSDLLSLIGKIPS